MRQVNVDKEDLLLQLKENRENHVDTFDQVLEAYKQEAIRQLEDHIERIRNGEVAQVRVILPEPKNYEKEYDQAIAAVEWEQSAVIELTQREFNCYVLDEWEWKAEFAATSAMYDVS